MVWIRSLVLLGAALAVAALLHAWVSPSAAAAWLAAAMAVTLVYHAFFLDRLTRWANLPRNRPLPIGWGVWTPLITRLNRFMRQENDTLGELGSELERIHAAVDRLPDGLVVLDRFDHVVWSNDAAQSLHGIFGTRRPIHHFIRQPEFAELLQGEGEMQSMRLHLPANPGRIYELRLHRTDEQHRLLITRDVTEQAKLDAMRSDFVANVSHEIRTPATVIAGFAETLLTLDLDEDSKREYLAAILKQSQTMGRLVEDLLLLSSLESATDELQDSPTDVRAMLEALASEARALSGGRHAVSLSLEGPRRVLAAPTELESAIRNLLTNAIRYTPDGGRISIEWRVRDHEGWITVRDTGIGIAAEHLPRLTERFYRVDRGRSRETGGTGLGLAIVKRILTRHQGALHVESRPGAGSAFSLRLPARRLLPDEFSAPGAPAAESAPAAEAGGPAA